MVKQIRFQTKDESTSLKAYPAKKHISFVDHLGRNLAIACAILFTVSAFRNAGLPDGRTVAAAVRDLTQWDDHLGSIEFVGNFFPETVSVFLESHDGFSITSPCSAQTAHQFTSDEPYVSFLPGKAGTVYAPADGQVTAVAHGLNDEIILRLRHDDGYETLYYGLSELLVREGDPVTDQTCLGYAVDGAEVFFEVRRAGLPVDPTQLLQAREAGSP